MNATRYTIAEPLPYVIHDRPDEVGPLRRLIREGGEVLSVSELIAVILGTSSSSTAIIKEYGSSILKSLRTVNELVETLKIDQVQATRLLAALSLGKRIYEPNLSSQIVLRDSQDVFIHCRSMANLAREELKVLLLNSHYQLIHEEVLAIGSTEHLHVQPRDVYQAAIERRVPAIILVHNHPSENSKPSSTDREFTIKMQESGRLLGIELLDHLVITRDSYASCLTS